MSYATRMVKGHLNHFLGEGWTVKKVEFPPDHYKVTLVNTSTLDEVIVTDESHHETVIERQVASQVRLFFNRYPVGD